MFLILSFEQGGGGEGPHYEVTTKINMPQIEKSANYNKL